MNLFHKNLSRISIFLKTKSIALFSHIIKWFRSTKAFFFRIVRGVKHYFKNIFQIIKIILIKTKDSAEIIFGFIVYFTTLLLGFILYLFHLIDLLSLILLFLALLIASIPLLIYFIKKREQTLFICLTSKYLMEKDESRLDDLLGVLIAGKLERLKLNPVDEFFNGIVGFCETGDVETRRRISEALPALYKINMVNSKNIVSFIRNDWDRRWRADNRRRTIESFNYLINNENKFILENLKIVKKDDFLTLIAILEVLYALEGSFSKKIINHKITEITNDMILFGFKQHHIDLFNDIWSRLNMIKENIELATEEFITISKKESDLELKIFAARNFRLLCDGYPNCYLKSHCLSATPERTIKFINNFLSEVRYKNVRRPLAKERSLDCLVMLLKIKSLKTRVKEIIWKLIKDNDDIIRITTFDKIDNISDVDKEFALKIIRHISKNESNIILKDRAKRVQSRIH